MAADGAEAGALFIAIRNDKDKHANSLPAAAGNFSVVMRMCWPKHEMLDGIWILRPVRMTE